MRWEYCNILQCVDNKRTANTSISTTDVINFVLIGVAVMLMVISIILIVIIYALCMIMKRRSHAKFLYTSHTSSSNDYVRVGTVRNNMRDIDQLSKENVTNNAPAVLKETTV